MLKKNSMHLLNFTQQNDYFKSYIIVPNGKGHICLSIINATYYTSNMKIWF